MYSRRPRVDGNDMDLGDGGFHFVHRPARAENPRHQLQVGDARLPLCGVEILVFPVAGEVEQPGRQPLLIDALGNKFLLLDCQPHVAILCGERHAFPSVRGVGLLRVAARHDHILAVEVAPSPFNGAGNDVRAVLGNQSGGN